MRQRCPLIVSFEYVCVYVFIYMNEHLCTYTHTSINVSIDISIEKRTFILNVQALHCANGSVTLLLKCCSGKGCLCGSIVDNATCNLAAHPIVNHGTSCNFLSIFSYIIDFLSRSRHAWTCCEPAFVCSGILYFIFPRAHGVFLVLSSHLLFSLRKMHCLCCRLLKDKKFLHLLSYPFLLYDLITKDIMPFTRFAVYLIPQKEGCYE